MRGNLLLLLLLGAAHNQSAAPATYPAFEAVSIRQHAGPLRKIRDFSASGPRLTLEGYRWSELALEAYDLKVDELKWQPAAAPKNDVYYDILAKAEGDTAPTKADFRVMLQNLLTQRFHLKAHSEMRTRDVYALRIGKSGIRFEPSAPDAPKSGLFGMHGQNQTIEMPRESMDALAEDIRGGAFVDRPVLNETGLQGIYDIKLEATTYPRMQGEAEPDQISIFTAVQQQLGLRLEPSKAKIRVLVVDHVEDPSEN